MRFFSPPIEGSQRLKIKSGFAPENGDQALKVLAALRQGAILLTASSGLAADWKRRLAIASGAEVIETPAVESWQQWITRLASECMLPVPFNAVQEQQLWESIIAADLPGGRDNASIAGLARHAARAYRLLRDYRVPADALIGGGVEAEAFERWLAAMQRWLRQHERALAADLPAMLLKTIVERVYGCTLLLDGFDDPTPMQQVLLEALLGGNELTVIAFDDRQAAMTLTACADAKAEYRHVAERVAAVLQENAQARIAIVTSPQVKDAETLRRMLDETLLPQGMASVEMQAVNMAGPPLASAPLIRQALALLQLAGKGGAAFADLAPLLFSPGVKGFADERFGRAVLDARLREENRHYVGFRALLGMDALAGMPQLASVIEALQGWETQARSAGEWVRAVHGLLHDIGYLQPNAAGRGSGEIRQLNSFRECLASLVSVDAVHERLEWGRFLALLADLCSKTPLSLPAYYPQVCVLPLEQAAGFCFDRVFAVGFDEEALPLPAQPSPLLPFSLQRKYGLPLATATLAYAESACLWQQLARSAPVVHFSYASSREERELHASPWLAGLAAHVFELSSPARPALTTACFDDAPLVPLGSEERVCGGSAIVRNQSACPFRAFATHRLQLAPLGETTPGIDPASKGSLLHEALQHIWEKLRAQAALLALGEGEVATLIDEAVDYAWREARVHVAEATQKFERQRMAMVLATWLQQERQRPPFWVERCEKAYRLELPEAGAIRFPVSLKADRIDRDGEGHRILIDYKSGQKQSIGKWVGERMAEPQLPLYAIAEELGSEDAVCFARVRSGDMGFEGLSGEATGIKGIAVYSGKDEEAETWPDLLVLWRQRLNALAAEFVDGRCEVSPRDTHACDHCGLEPVCRIDEIGIDRDAEDET